MILSVHPSLKATSSCNQGGGGLLGDYPSCIRAKAWWHHRQAKSSFRSHIKRQTTIHTYTYSQWIELRSCPQFALHVFGLCDKTTVPRENPHRHRENKQTHTKQPQALPPLQSRIVLFSFLGWRQSLISPNLSFLCAGKCVIERQVWKQTFSEEISVRQHLVLKYTLVSLMHIKLSLVLNCHNTQS